MIKKVVVLSFFISILFSAKFEKSTVVAQTTVSEELSKRNLTLQQARQLARQAGVNPDDPNQLASFARSNGASEAQIQAWLQELGLANGNAVQSPGQVQDLRDASISAADIIESEPLNVGRVSPETSSPPTKDGLPYFGYEIFSNIPDAFKPANVGPVDDGYIIGPEDEMRLAVWGATEFQYELAVDAEGRIFIPTIGQITVAGQTLKDLREYLKNILSKSYSGLTRNPPTIFMDVTLTRLRPIRVFVIGELENPGGYTFSSYSTLFNVLYGVGGPTVNGSLRNIQLIRDGKVETTFDLYEFLLKGIDSGSIRLQNNDRIFIPPRANRVSLEGPVLRPAIYELKKGEGLQDIINFAGGLKPEAYGKRFNVQRIIPLAEREDPSVARVVVDYSLEAVLSGTESFIPVDGDKIRLLGISDRLENVVYISGVVFQPGAYEISSEIKSVKDLITAADGLRDGAYSYRGELVRTNSDLSKTFFPLNIDTILSGENDMALQRLDVVEIYSNDVEVISNRFVEINGSVENAGRYEYSENLTLGDLILIAGGLREDAYLGDIEISRLEKPEDINSKSVQIFVPLVTGSDKEQFYTPSLMKDLLLEADKFELTHRDKIFIRSNPRFKAQESVSIRGEVLYPGTYVLLSENERLSEVLSRTGGLTPEGYAKGAKLIRNGNQIIIDIEQAISGRGYHDIELFAGDEIVVPRIPNTVAVRGNVGNEGLVKFQPGKKVSYYLERVGGIQKESERRILLTQPDGTTYSVRRKGLFKKNPEVFDGATILVQRKTSRRKKRRPNPKRILTGNNSAINGGFNRNTTC